jgi:very-short-patch-repair endonuclease
MSRRPCRVNPVLLTLARELRHRFVPAEQKLWQCLRNRKLNGYKFRRQFPVDCYVADFYCAECKLVVELDGKSHVGRQECDAIRTEDLNERGLSVIRFRNDDVHKRLDSVLHTILSECEKRAASENCPSPRPSTLSTGAREKTA